MTIKVLRDNCIFILAVAIFLSSCQLTTTGEKKSVLDEYKEWIKDDLDYQSILLLREDPII